MDTFVADIKTYMTDEQAKLKSNASEKKLFKDFNAKKLIIGKFLLSGTTVLSILVTANISIAEQIVDIVIVSSAAYVRSKPEINEGEAKNNPKYNVVETLLRNTEVKVDYDSCKRDKFLGVWRYWCRIIENDSSTEKWIASDNFCFKSLIDCIKEGYYPGSIRNRFPYALSFVANENDKTSVAQELQIVLREAREEFSKLTNQNQQEDLGLDELRKIVDKMRDKIELFETRNSISQLELRPQEQRDFVKKLTLIKQQILKLELLTWNDSLAISTYKNNIFGSINDLKSTLSQFDAFKYFRFLDQFKDLGKLKKRYHPSVNFRIKQVNN